jgi:hypothetical protein
VFAVPLGGVDTVVPLVAGEDVARVAAGLITAADVPAGSSYPVIGEVMTVGEIVATMGRGLGQEIRFQDVPDELWAEAALDRINAHAVAHLSKLWASLRTQSEPLVKERYQVTDTIERFGGGRPKPFAQFVSEEKSSFLVASGDAVA